jgi:phosphohistidine phosphatase
MKTVFFLRHATSPHHTPLSDVDRPLDAQGRGEAKEVAAYFQTNKLTVDLVLCSVALRAQETLEPLRSVLGTHNIEVSEGFYNISDNEILEVLQSIPNGISRILYIGHNPGIAFAILKLSDSFPEFLTQGIEPATLVEFQFNIETWKNVGWKKGKVMRVFHPDFVLPGSPAQEEQ